MNRLIEEKIATYKRHVTLKLGDGCDQSYIPGEWLGQPPFNVELRTLHVDRIQLNRLLRKIVLGCGVTFLEDRVVAVETNGTIAAPAGLDWLCVSPKAGAELAQRSGDELKLVYPQAGADPSDFEALAFRHFFLQPMDGPSRAVNTELALRYCLDHPQWRLSLQTHKLLGIP